MNEKYLQVCPQNFNKWIWIILNVPSVPPILFTLIFASHTNHEISSLLLRELTITSRRVIYFFRTIHKNILITSVSVRQLPGLAYFSYLVLFTHLLQLFPIKGENNLSVTESNPLFVLLYSHKYCNCFPSRKRIRRDWTW